MKPSSKKQRTSKQGRQYLKSSTRTPKQNIISSKHLAEEPSLNNKPGTAIKDAGKIHGNYAKDSSGQYLKVIKSAANDTSQKQSMDGDQPLSLHLNEKARTQFQESEIKMLDMTSMSQQVPFSYRSSDILAIEALSMQADMIMTGADVRNNQNKPQESIIVLLKQNEVQSGAFRANSPEFALQFEPFVDQASCAKHINSQQLVEVDPLDQATKSVAENLSGSINPQLWNETAQNRLNMQTSLLNQPTNKSANLDNLRYTYITSAEAANSSKFKQNNLCQEQLQPEKSCPLNVTSRKIEQNGADPNKVTLGSQTQNESNLIDTVTRKTLESGNEILSYLRSQRYGINSTQMLSNSMERGKSHDSNEAIIRKSLAQGHQPFIQVGRQQILTEDNHVKSPR